MIIKCSRGYDFAGLIDYLLRRGEHQDRGEARIIRMEGVYDERTAAAQMARNAALAPCRMRPVVHMMARAEVGLSDARNAELSCRMVDAAGLAGRPYMAVVHDDDHVHVVVCEMDDLGRPPPRIQFAQALGRPVTSDEAKAMPKGAVKSRAWDSHLPMRLAKLARQLEVEWGLRELPSRSVAIELQEPQLLHSQRQRLEARGEVALQDRYFDQVRSALVLPSWEMRIRALGQHGLNLRVVSSGERKRGLQLYSISNPRECVKISAFGFGGLAKLDASADQPFVEYQASHPRPPITLNKPEKTFDQGFQKLQVQFREEIKQWHRATARRKSAFKRYKAEKLAVGMQIEQLRLTLQPCAGASAARFAASGLRRDLVARAQAELSYALAEAGPARKKPVFAEFVKRRARLRDADAIRIWRDLQDKVTETRRLRIAKMIASLRRSLHGIRERAKTLHNELKAFTQPLSVATSSLKSHGLALRASEAEARRQSQQRQASDLAMRADQAGHRILVDPNRCVRIESWTVSATDKALLDDPSNLAIFERMAAKQTAEVDALKDLIRQPGLLRRTTKGNYALSMKAVEARCPASARWSRQAEVLSLASIVIAGLRQQQHDEARNEKALASNILLNQSHTTSAEATRVVSHLAAAESFRSQIEQILREDEERRADEQATQSARAARARLLEQRTQEALEQRAREQSVAPQSADRHSASDPARRPLPDASVVQAEQRKRLLAATSQRPGDSPEVRQYLENWAARIHAFSADRPMGRNDLVAIENQALLGMVRQGLTATQIEPFLEERSPASALGMSTLADVQRNQAINDELARQRDQQDRARVLRDLGKLAPPSETGKEFVRLWQELLEENLVNPNASSEDRNRAIDHDVARMLIKRRCAAIEVAEAIMDCSPSLASKPPSDRKEYATELLSYFIDEDGYRLLIQQMTASSGGNESTRPLISVQPMPDSRRASTSGALSDDHDAGASGDHLKGSVEGHQAQRGQIYRPGAHDHGL